MSLERKNLLIIISVLLFLVGFLGYFAGRSITQKQEEGSFPPQSGVVTAVYDGDTLKVKFKNGSERKVRLVGVDAPEMGDSRKEVQLQASLAKRFAFFYLYGESIKLTYDWELEDKYDRILAYVWTEGEGLFNKLIISEGFASVFQGFPFRYRDEFVEAEKEARRLEKGFWKRGGYPAISAGEANVHIGSLITVKYTCGRVQEEEKFIFLHSSKNEFSALIPMESLNLFPDVKSYRGQALSVTGFLEEYKGNPQIVAFFPSQIIISIQ
ncbi:MAG: thermonuclease family protein [Candidatus Aminicenantes bacterium]|nr:MAG: thermonuclease family protein [Candidatus Aminicenantes bacterium]